MFDHVLERDEERAEAGSWLSRKVVLAIVAAIKFVESEKFDPTGTMCRAVVTIPSLNRSKLDDAEELEDLLIQGCIRRSTGLWCGLDVERLGVLGLRIEGELGFHWLNSGGGCRSCPIVHVAPFFEKEVDVDDVFVNGLDDLGVYVLPVRIRVGKECEDIVVDLVELYAFLSKFVRTLVLNTIFVGGDAHVNVLERGVAFNPCAFD